MDRALRSVRFAPLKRAMSSRLSTTTAAASKGSRRAVVEHDLNVPCVQGVLVEPKPPNRRSKPTVSGPKGKLTVGSVGLAHRLERLEQAFVGDQRSSTLARGDFAFHSSHTESRRSPPASRPRQDVLQVALHDDGGRAEMGQHTPQSSSRCSTTALRVAASSSPPTARTDGRPSAQSRQRVVHQASLLPMARARAHRSGGTPVYPSASGPSRPHASTRPGRRPTWTSWLERRKEGRVGRVTGACSTARTRRAAETWTVVNLTAN